VAFPISGETLAVRAIGIDPGLSRTGFGVVETLPRGGKACEWGTIRTETGSPAPLRLKIIYDGLKKLFEAWRPDLLVIEDVYVSQQFPKAAIQLGEVRGVICLAAQENHIPVLEVKPTEVKSALTGSGRADKGQMQKMIQRLLRMEESAGSSHAGDALALALTGLSRNGNFHW
jgi:crossover junction endodeoxyribonuclease RuvC